MVTYPNTVIPSIIVTKIAQKEVFRVSNIDYMYHKHDQKPKNQIQDAEVLLIQKYDPPYNEEYPYLSRKWRNV